MTYIVSVGTGADQKWVSSASCEGTCSIEFNTVQANAWNFQTQAAAEVVAFLVGGSYTTGP